jgi:hypothetical protein
LHHRPDVNGWGRLIRNGLAIASLFVGTAGAHAQSVDVTVGYQFLHSPCADCDARRSIPTDVAGRLTPIFEWVGTFEGAPKRIADTQPSTLTFFGGGARWNSRVSAKGVKPFAQVLVGARRTVDVDDFGSLPQLKFALGVDGGVVLPLMPRASVVGEFGIRRIASSPGTRITPRMVVGLRWRLGSERSPR